MKPKEEVVINNTLFVLCDVVESLMLNAERLYKLQGKEFKHQSKKDFKSTLFTLRRFLSSVRDCSLENQMQFGDDAEEMREFILLFVDRVNDDEARSKLFLDYLKNCSSLLNFDFDKIK